MNPDFFLSFSRRDVELFVKQRTGLRRSNRLSAAVEIALAFGGGIPFHRAAVLELLSSRFYWKCLDRAVDALLAGGLIRECPELPLTMGGGRSFVFAHADDFDLDQRPLEELGQAFSDDISQDTGTDDYDVDDPRWYEAA